MKLLNKQLKNSLSCSWIQSIAWRQLWNASLNISDRGLKSCTAVREEELCIEQSCIYIDLNLISHMGRGGKALSLWKNMIQRYILLLRVLLMHLTDPAEFQSSQEISKKKTKKQKTKKQQQQKTVVKLAPVFILSLSLEMFLPIS